MRQKCEELAKSVFLVRHHPLVLCLLEVLPSPLLEVCEGYLSDSFCSRCLRSFPKNVGVCVNLGSRDCMLAFRLPRTFELVLSSAPDENNEIVQFFMNAIYMRTGGKGGGFIPLAEEHKLSANVDAHNTFTVFFTNANTKMQSIFCAYTTFTDSALVFQYNLNYFQ